MSYSQQLPFRLYTKAMRQKKYNLLKKLAIDIVGVVMIIGSILFGWIPGPGGIPLLIGGLGLLSVNHIWAGKLLQKIKDKW